MFFFSIYKTIPYDYCCYVVVVFVNTYMHTYEFFQLYSRKIRLRPHIHTFSDKCCFNYTVNTFER